MLDHLGLHDEAKNLHLAIEATTAQGVLTRDIGGTATTDQVVEALIAHLSN
jgi:tartrate dehydrogenase/decarboxylase/D-malate dehydrogenase